ncbi:carbohydrate sulfotransferase 11-like [Physella acuta]|uniref:carbohydrate sulfotransferase 11-like n=1 Tax=Physella acuta TaxID=109671 RepID=UPI0027DC1767|nr:carbohydrate sulfotransferase 11-like [Physella acuta]
MMLGCLVCFCRHIKRKVTSRCLIGGIILLCITFAVIRSKYNFGVSDMPGQEMEAVHDHIQQRHQSRNSLNFDDVINATYHDLDRLREEQQTRTQHLHAQCDLLHNTTRGLSSEDWAYGRIEVDHTQHYLYCPLLKVGSTFFRRVFYTMRQGRRLVNPYLVPINKALAAKRNVLTQILPLTSPETTAFLNNATSIIFVREPFSRILSGYVDKLFAPNPYFWSQIGKYVVSKFRPEAKRKDLVCGSDVTFEEFISYLIDGELTNSSHRDAHFTPAYDQCKPCHLNYTVVGKMETFQTDVSYTLAQLGFNVSKEKLSQWSNDATHDAILDSIVSPFGWRSMVRKCMSWYEGLKRIWRKIQIRGIISMEEKFPWSRDFSERSVTIRMFTDRVKKLHAQTDKTKLKKQRKEVVIEAFSRIKQEDLKKLVEMFRPDFQLFEYDTRPDFIFSEEIVKPFRQKNNLFNVFNV